MRRINFIDKAFHPQCQADPKDSNNDEMTMKWSLGTSSMPNMLTQMLSESESHNFPKRLTTILIFLSLQKRWMKQNNVEPLVICIPHRLWPGNQDVNNQLQQYIFCPEEYHKPVLNLLT